MECPICRQILLVASCKPKSAVGTEEVTLVQTMVCPNPKCDNYCGPDLGKPLKVAAVVENRWE